MSKLSSILACTVALSICQIKSQAPEMTRDIPVKKIDHNFFSLDVEDTIITYKKIKMIEMLMKDSSGVYKTRKKTYFGYTEDLITSLDITDYDLGDSTVFYRNNVVLNYDEQKRLVNHTERYSIGYFNEFAIPYVSHYTYIDDKLSKVTVLKGGSPVQEAVFHHSGEEIKTVKVFTNDNCIMKYVIHMNRRGTPVKVDYYNMKEEWLQTMMYNYDNGINPLKPLQLWNLGLFPLPQSDAMPVLEKYNNNDQSGYHTFLNTYDVDNYPTSRIMVDNGVEYYKENYQYY